MMKRRVLASLLLFGIATPAFSEAVEDRLYASSKAAQLAGKVMTVAGPVDPAVLGSTLMHEHLAYDWFEGVRHSASSAAQRKQFGHRMAQAGWRSPRTDEDWRFFNSRDVTLDMIDEMRRDRRVGVNYRSIPPDDLAPELQRFYAAGGRAIVDLTPEGLGRNTQALKRISAKTRLHVIAGAGWYRWPFHPRYIRDRSVDELVAHLGAMVITGDANGVRSGIIGEIPVDSRSIRISESGPIPESAEIERRSSLARIMLLREPARTRGDMPIGNIYDSAELKVLRAAARTARITGAALALHVTDPWLGFVGILEAEKVDLGRVIVGHAHPILADPELRASALQRGLVLQADYLLQHYPTKAPLSDPDPILDGIIWAVRNGYRGQILLSLDICNRIGLKRYGGGGYTTLHSYVLPALKARGLTEEDVRAILVENPRRLLTLAPPQHPVTR